jgi:hypothetical protein
MLSGVLEVGGVTSCSLLLAFRVPAAEQICLDRRTISEHRYNEYSAHVYAGMQHSTAVTGLPTTPGKTGQIKFTQDACSRLAATLGCPQV